MRAPYIYVLSTGFGFGVARAHPAYQKGNSSTANGPDVGSPATAPDLAITGFVDLPLTARPQSCAIIL